MKATSKKDFRLFAKLFVSTFNLSAFTLGGGYVIIPLMKKKFVEEFGWIEEEEMMDLAAIAQSSPGAIAVNASILVGYRLGGVLGALLTTLATVLPPLIILSVISLAYTAFKESLVMHYLLRGMQAGVAAVVADVVYGMAKGVIKKRQALPIGIMVCSFIAASIAKVNVVVILLFCILLGVFTTLYQQRKEGTKK